MSRTMRTVVAVVVALAMVVALALAALLSLGGGSGSSTPDPEGASAATSSEASPEPEPEPGATRPPDPALAGFYSQELDWSGCGDGHECASLEVPVDYDEPEGETIELALLRVPASGERHGSLVLNPGGPGAPGTDYAAQADTAFGDRVRAAYDIVGFDPRGTGESSPVDCFPDARLDDYVAADPAPDTAAEERAFAADVRALGRGCVQRTGDLINHVTTVETARDMDVLRAALGQQALDFFGASYGTKLGATYAELFPEEVGRFVLDGAVDVSLSTKEQTVQQAAGFQTAITAYVDHCLSASEPCFLGSSRQEGLQTIRDLLDRIEREPMPTQGERELRIGNAFYGVVTPLYNRDYWYILSAALESALEGDGAALLQLSDIYNARGPDGYTDNSSEAIYAINCLDDPSAVPFDRVAQHYDEFERVSPTFGRVFAWSLTGCNGLQATSDVEVPTIRAEGAAPILVIGTTRDPATPYRWAQALAEQLASGVLLTREGDGHTGYHAGNECVDTTVADYLVKGTVPRDGKRC